MAWVRIEDTVPGHPKLLRAGPAAAWLWVCGIAYCQRQLADGFIPIEAVGQLGVNKGVKPLLDILVRERLFEVVDGGYLVHDYLRYNLSRDEAVRKREYERETKSRGGRAGAARRWQKDDSLPSASHSRPMTDSDGIGMGPPNGLSMAPSPPIPRGTAVPERLCPKGNNREGTSGSDLTAAQQQGAAKPGLTARSSAPGRVS